MLALCAGMAWATDRYVSTTGSNTNSGTSWNDAWRDIQYAVSHVSVVGGDVIHVAAGTYNENVNITKSLTLQAASKPVIDGGQAGACITITANGVTIDGFELKNGSHGIFSLDTDNSTIKNCDIHDNLCTSFGCGMGIGFWTGTGTVDFDNNTIVDNTIYNNDRQGIYIGWLSSSPPTVYSDGNTIRGNTIYNNGLYTLTHGPDESEYGIQLCFADNNTIQDNEIYGHNDWWFGQGIYLFASYDNTVTGNNIHDNSYGINSWEGGGWTGRTIGNNHINYNTIAGNGFGMWNIDGVAVTVDAECNWWGDASGPSGEGPGTGDAVSANVEYSPWLGATPGTSPMTWHTDDSIQEAIDLAEPGDKIQVHEGEYYGAEVNKAVEIKGEEGVVINDGPLHGSGNRFGFKLYYGSGTGAKISHFTFLGDGTKDQIGFPIFGYRTDNVTIEHNTMIMSLQAITNWHGSGWKIRHNKIDGLWDYYGGGIGVFIGCFNETPPANDNKVEHNKIVAHIEEPMQEYSTPGICLFSDHRWDYPGGNVKENKVNHNKVDFTGQEAVGIELTDLSDDIDEVTGNVLAYNHLQESTYPWALNPWDEVLGNNFFKKNKPQPEPQPELVLCGLSSTLAPKPYGPEEGKHLAFNRVGASGSGLLQSSPNPFTKRTAISFTLPASSHTTLKIYDITGRLVATLVDGKLSAGAHSLTWEKDGTPSGIYFYKLTSGNLTATKKLVVLR